MTIVFGIIKVILIIILILLALLLILTGLILFAPIRYRIKGSIHDEIPCGTAEAKWLYGVLGFRASAGKGEMAQAYISVCGFKLLDLLEDDNEEDFTGESSAEASGGARRLRSAAKAEGSYKNKAASLTEETYCDIGAAGPIAASHPDNKKIKLCASKIAEQTKLPPEQEQKDGSSIGSKARITVYSTHSFRDKLESIREKTAELIHLLISRVKLLTGRIMEFPRRLGIG